MKDLSTIHLVGIKGVAMTSLAIIAKERGLTVSGSDVEEVFPTDQILRENQIGVRGFGEIDFDEQRPDLVIYTGAHKGRHNPEVQAALERGISVASHAEALGLIMDGMTQISIAGSHGKTTTSAMVAVMLSACGLDPSYAVGCGNITRFGPPGHHGSGSMFVAEADEYMTDPAGDTTPRFLWQQPSVLVITNVEYDHPDVYENIASVEEAFGSLIKKVSKTGTIVANADDPRTMKLVDQAHCAVMTYGMKNAADISIKDVRYHGGAMTYTVQTRDDGTQYSGELHAPGVHNVMNATAAICVGMSFGLSVDRCIEGLRSFYGTKRRFEHIGCVRGVDIYDDYAHHPTEVRATLEAMRQLYPKRKIFAVFQPHTYSRTEALLEEFARSFDIADEVILTQIYGSAREKEFSAEQSAEMISRLMSYHPCASFLKTKKQVLSYVEEAVVAGDIVLFMGAGSIYLWSSQMYADLKGDL